MVTMYMEIKNVVYIYVYTKCLFVLRFGLSRNSKLVNWHIIIIHVKILNREMPIPLVKHKLYMRNKEFMIPG